MSKIPLPPWNIRTGTVDFLYDDVFINSTLSEIDIIQKNKPITSNTKVLDIGCGVGRFAIGLLHHVEDIGYYKGLDVDLKRITWCKYTLAHNLSNYDFERINVYNERYNRVSKTKIDDDFRFDIEDNFFDIVYLYSVFSHMVSDDISIYLKEISRILSDDGVVFLTAFVEKDIGEQVKINPDNFGSQLWHGSLHCVLYDYDFFVSILNEYNFRIVEERWKKGTDEQTIFLLKWD